MLRKLKNGTVVLLQGNPDDTYMGVIVEGRLETYLYENRIGFEEFDENGEHFLSVYSVVKVIGEIKNFD